MRARARGEARIAVNVPVVANDLETEHLGAQVGKNSIELVANMAREGDTLYLRGVHVGGPGTAQALEEASDAARKFPAPVE